MSSLYVNESGAVISVDGGYFCVTQKNGLVRKLPKELVESITIFGNSSVTTPCIQECLRRGVCVNYFSGKGIYYGKLSSTRHVNGERLKKQIYACDNAGFRLPMAKKVTSAKIQNQTVILRRYARNRDVNISSELLTMKQLEHRHERCTTIEELMGVEGMAARTNIFSDVKSTDWFYRAVVNSTQYGWIHGYGDGTFRPNNPITRVEVTAIVNNMLGREADVDFVTEHYDELNHFSDLAVSHWGYYHIVEATNDHDYTKPSSGENWTELN